MVRETKSKDQLKLRTLQKNKIKCSKKHFETIGFDYDFEDEKLTKKYNSNYPDFEKE